MEWQPIETAPKQKQDCIVLTKDGAVFRAISHKGWQGGFCIGDGKTGIALYGVTHWMLFTEPSNAALTRRP